MICQLYDLWYREHCINMLSDQYTAMNWNLSLMTTCIIVPECKIKVLKHWKLYKDAYILQESFAMTDKSYWPPCRNYLQPLYLSVKLYACAQRVNGLLTPLYSHLSPAGFGKLVVLIKKISRRSFPNELSDNVEHFKYFSIKIVYKT